MTRQDGGIWVTFSYAVLPICHMPDTVESYSIPQWLKCKIRCRKSVGPPVSGRVPFLKIVTIRGGGTLWTINWRWGTAVPCVLLHFMCSFQPLNSTSYGGSHHLHYRSRREVIVTTKLILNRTSLTAFLNIPISYENVYVDDLWCTIWRILFSSR